MKKRLPVAWRSGGYTGLAFFNGKFKLEMTEYRCRFRFCVVFPFNIFIFFTFFGGGFILREGNQVKNMRLFLVATQVRKEKWWMMGGLYGMREGPQMDVNVLCIGRYNISGWCNRGRSSSLIHFSHIFSDSLEIKPLAEDLFTNSSISKAMFHIL